VIIHGGCWLSQFNLRHAANQAAGLATAGVATWTIEYRRVGSPGGGWPGTFHDIAMGIDHLRALAGPFTLDTTRVVLVGHSAGGHLALWAAARTKLPRTSEIASPSPLRVRGVVSLAGVPDLRRAATGAQPICGDAIARLVGGTPDQVGERFRQVSPIELLPLGVPQALITGAEDQIVPPQWGADYGEAARRAGDRVTVTTVPEAGHFEVIVPTTKAWKIVEAAVLGMVQ
jgi:acetyl esterase/lipase